MLQIVLLLDLNVYAGDNSDYRAAMPANKEDGAPRRGEQKTQRGDKPLGETHLEGPA